MKKLNLLVTIIIAICTLCYSGCKKQELDLSENNDGQKSALQNNNQLLSLQQIKDNTKATAIGLAYLVAVNNNFNNLVHDEVSKKFDNDFDALTKTISERSQNELNLNLKVELQTKASQHGFSISNNFIDGFKYEEETIYPQIFISDFDSVNKNQTPVVAAYYHDDAPTIEGF